MFDDFTYTQFVPQFVGSNVAQIGAISNVLQDQYNKNIADQDNLELTINSLPHRAINSPGIEEALQKAKNNIKSITDSGRWEDAGQLIKESAKQLATDKKIKGIVEDKKRYDDWISKLTEKRNKGEIDSTSYKNAIRYSNALNGQPVNIDDETGDTNNLFSGMDVTNTIDLTKQALEIANGWKSNEEPFILSTDKDGNPVEVKWRKDIQGFYTTGSNEYVSEDEIVSGVTRALMNKPENINYVNQQLMFDRFNRLAEKDEEGNYLLNEENNLTYRHIIPEDLQDMGLSGDEIGKVLESGVDLDQFYNDYFVNDSFRKSVLPAAMKHGFRKVKEKLTLDNFSLENYKQKNRKRLEEFKFDMENPISNLILNDEMTSFTLPSGESEGDVIEYSANMQKGIDSIISTLKQKGLSINSAEDISKIRQLVNRTEKEGISVISGMSASYIKEKLYEIEYAKRNKDLADQRLEEAKNIVNKDLQIEKKSNAVEQTIPEIEGYTKEQIRDLMWLKLYSEPGWGGGIRMNDINRLKEKGVIKTVPHEGYTVENADWFGLTTRTKGESVLDVANKLYDDNKDLRLYYDKIKQYDDAHSKVNSNIDRYLKDNSVVDITTQSQTAMPGYVYKQGVNGPYLAIDEKKVKTNTKIVNDYFKDVSSLAGFKLKTLDKTTNISDLLEEMEVDSDERDKVKIGTVSLTTTPSDYSDITGKSQRAFVIPISYKDKVKKVKVTTDQITSQEIRLMLNNPIEKANSVYEVGRAAGLRSYRPPEFPNTEIVYGNSADKSDDLVIINGVDYPISEGLLFLADAIKNKENE